MASGILTLQQTGNKYLAGQIVWESVSNGTEKNTSTVTATLQIQRAALNTTTGTFTGTFAVGDTSVSISEFLELPSKTWITVHTITATISHNTNGTGNCYLYAIVNGPTGTTMAGTSVSGSETVTLDTIPRYAAIVSAPDFHDEENPAIIYSNPAGTSVTALEACISLDGSTDDVAYRAIEKNGSSYTFSLTDAERDVLRAATTEANSRTVRFFVRTKIGDTIGRSSLTKTFSVKDPEPTLNPSVSDSNDTTYGLTGSRSTFVKYYSNAAVKFNASAVKGASIVSQQVTCGSKRRTTDGAINKVESGTFKFTVTDSRGNTVTKNALTGFVEYIKLTCDLANNIPGTDGNMTVSVSGNYFNGSFGAKDNSLKVYCRYKTIGGEYPDEWTKMEVTVDGNSYTAVVDVTGLDYQTAYVFQAYAEDRLSQVTSVDKRVKATPVFDWGEIDFQFHVPVSMPQNGIGVTGNKAITLEDANDGIATGWYRITGDTKNGVSVAAIMRAESITESNVVQTAFAGGYSNVYFLVQQRYCHNGLWSEWEWVNPPMLPDTEYRTTARYNGKPVYVIRLTVGAMGNSTAISAQLPSEPTEIVELTGLAVSGTTVEKLPLITTNGTVGAMIRKTGTKTIAVKTFGDYTGYTAIATVKYTKD